MSADEHLQEKQFPKNKTHTPGRKEQELNEKLAAHKDKYPEPKGHDPFAFAGGDE
jgi:hypothetical protein